MTKHEDYKSLYQKLSTKVRGNITWVGMKMRYSEYSSAKISNFSNIKT
ncbi:MAG: hypothetical protein N3D81_02265 [Spirochaetes bacterium]|nr:hypothetical protein [Spirochaetota bacterium]